MNLSLFCAATYPIMSSTGIQEIPFETEEELRARGTARTPDVLLSCPLSLNVPKRNIIGCDGHKDRVETEDDYDWKMICWIDSKVMLFRFFTQCFVLSVLTPTLFNTGSIWWCWHSYKQRSASSRIIRPQIWSRACYLLVWTCTDGKARRQPWWCNNYEWLSKWIHVTYRGVSFSKQRNDMIGTIDGTVQLHTPRELSNPGTVSPVKSKTKRMLKD